MKLPEPPVMSRGHVHSPDITPLLAVLRRVHPLTPGLEAFLRAHITSCSVRKRKLLLKEGSPCEHIYFIVKGALRGFIREGHKDITTWINTEGQLVSSIFGLDHAGPGIENIQSL